MKQLAISPSDVRDDPDNPNRMEPEDFEKLVQAIDKYGFLQPVLLRKEENEMVAIDGHHRLEAARKLDLEAVPALLLEEGDPAYDHYPIVQIGMNKLRGELDLGSVAMNFAELATAGWEVPDMAISGFSEEEVADLIASTAVDVDEEDLLAGTGTLPSTEEKAPKPFIIEVEFGSKEDYQACRKAIKRAGGKGSELADGLKILCGVE